MRVFEAAHSRFTVVLLVAAVHAVLLWLIWRVRVEHQETEEEFGSAFFFAAPEQAKRPDRKRPDARRRPAHRTMSSTPAAAVPSQAAAEIAVPALPPQPVPGASVDWQQQMGVVAAAVIEQGKDDARRAGALMRNLQPSDAFQPLHEKRHDSDWYLAHTHLVYSASGVPMLVLTQPCAVVIFIIKDCTIDRIEPHGALFEYMIQETDAALSYGGPNAVP
ncbi:MAG: hypothetical protein WDM77_05955 [Steroidobacteraceae bacterium]